MTGAAADTPAARVATARTLVAADSQDDCNNTRGVPPYASGLPVLPCLRNPFSGDTLWNDGGAYFNPITQGVTKAKMTIALTSTVFRVFYITCNSNPPPNFPPCPFPVQFPRFDTSVSPGVYSGVFADVWPQADIPNDPQFGVFPKTQVDMLAFGSLPVRATVTIKQKTGPDGLPVPFKLAWWSSQQYIRPGKEVPGYEQYGPAPPGNLFFAPPAEVSGDVDVVLSDLTVDGVPLPVGSDCHTSTTLSLGALGGFYKSGGPKAGIPTDDNPHRYQQTGAYQPLYGGGNSYLSGTVDLPAFSGCRNGSEDVSAVITGMVSSQDNPVDVTQQGPLRPFGCLAAPTDPACSTEHPPTADPPGAAQGAAYGS